MIVRSNPHTISLIPFLTDHTIIIIAFDVSWMRVAQKVNQPNYRKRVYRVGEVKVFFI